MRIAKILASLPILRSGLDLAREVRSLAYDSRRLQPGYYTDLVEEAAALWESFAQNHPFIDGNERTAFDATYTFLAVNGAPLTAPAGEAYAFISELTVASAQRQGGCVDKTRWATGRRPSILVPAPPGPESRRCAHPL